MHFYTVKNDQVEPRHFVPMTKDPSQLRPSRVTDARKAFKSGEIWYPSVTTVLNVLDKPALNNWKVDRHLEHAYQASASDYATISDYLYDVKRLTQLTLDQAPQAGTDIHKVLEDHLFESRDGLSDVERLIVGNVEKTLASRGILRVEKERYFVDVQYGYAGCADIVTSSGAHWVIDYKSKQEAAKFKPGKMAYPEHARQLAAYGCAIFGDADFKAANIFICLENGEIDFHEHGADTIDSGWADFLSCLSIYNRNTYAPAA